MQTVGAGLHKQRVEGSLEGCGVASVVLSKGALGRNCCHQGPCVLLTVSPPASCRRDFLHAGFPWGISRKFTTKSFREKNLNRIMHYKNAHKHNRNLLDRNNNKWMLLKNPTINNPLYYSLKYGKTDKFGIARTTDLTVWRVPPYMP
jgi:hypothetical protein